MAWDVLIRHKAEKGLRRLPRKDALKLKVVCMELGNNPFAGDIEKMTGEQNAWRRRVGEYRIFYELFPLYRTIKVFRIERRTTTTYRR